MAHDLVARCAAAEMQLAETRFRLAVMVGTHEASGRVTHWLHRQAMEKERARADGAMDQEAQVREELRREVIRRESLEHDLAKARAEIANLLQTLEFNAAHPPRRSARKRRASCHLVQ